MTQLLALVIFFGFKQPLEFFGKEGLETLIHGVSLTPPIVSSGYLAERS